jgi:hypothetical protein
MIDCFDFYDKFLIDHLSLSDRALEPAIITTGRYVQQLAHPTNAKVGLMSLDKSKPQFLGFEAKMATAFFKISRSWRVMASSRSS